MMKIYFILISLSFFTLNYTFIQFYHTKIHDDFYLVDIEQTQLPLNKLETEQTLHLQNNVSCTLADFINLSMNTIKDWKTSSGLLARGIILGKVDVTDYDDLILSQRTNNDWIEIFSTKRYTELLNYSSDVINESVKWALDNTPMFNQYSLPQTEYDGFFSLWNQFVLHGYRYARELNHSRDRWNAISAYEALKKCRLDFGRSFYECNPDTKSIKNMHGTRWMSTANLANCFMILYKETDIREALKLAFQEWTDLNKYYWNETRSAYDYSRIWRTWEWSSIEVFFNYEKLREYYNLVNWSRVYTDLQNRYLQKSWNSPLWNFNAKVVLHREFSTQKRLHGTLDAWMLIHSYFGHFNESNQNNVRRMLEGDGDDAAWRGLLSSEAQLYSPSTHRFKIDSNAKGDTDYATAEGCLTLFLLGISPQSGSGLMIPKRCDGYSGEPIPLDLFKFDYHKQQIIIPVSNNTRLKFLFGTIYPTYTFPENGLYKISFTSDWNSIITVELIHKFIDSSSNAMIGFNNMFQLLFLLLAGFNTVILLLLIVRYFGRI